MDSTTYKNITEYKTPMELDFYNVRNNGRILCSCGKMILKGAKWGHWRGLKHRRDTEQMLLTSVV